jgi:hypothetical protein
MHYGPIQDDEGKMLLQQDATGDYDLVFGDCTYDIIRDTMMADVGQIKNNPTIGVGLLKAKNGKPDAMMVHRTKTSLRAQGIITKRVIATVDGVAVETE